MVKIVRFEETGAPEVLRLFDEPLVEPGEGQVRLKVQAIGLNRAEIMLREGRYAADPVLPSRTGLEASGTIDAIGAGVSGFSIGDFVSAVPFLTWDKWGNWTQESLVKYGVYGESAIVPADTVAHNPANLSAEEGAAIWCQYLTAWGGLVDFAGVTSNDIRVGHGGIEQRCARRAADRQGGRRHGDRPDPHRGQARFPARGWRRLRGGDRRGGLG